MIIDFLGQNWHLLLGISIVLGLLLLEPMIMKATGIDQIDPLGVTPLVNRHAASIVDVSTSSEFSDAHIPNSINLPVAEIANLGNKFLKLKDKPLIISCRSGNRSKGAAKKLSKLGFKDIYLLTGGNLAWEKENFPMTRKH